MFSRRWDNKFLLKKDLWVYVPSDEMYAFGKKIHTTLSMRWKRPANYYHLIAGGHVAALKYHQSDSYFAKFDIKNFFNSISKTRITRSIKSLVGYSAAREIATVSTVPVSHQQSFSHCLPYGFVQSPILASICLRDSYLGRLIERKFKSCKISVYMDDIVISGNSESDVDALLNELLSAASKSHFEVNPSKVRLTSHTLESFNIELSQQTLNITADRLDAFKQEILNTENQAKIDAIIGYVKTVNISQAGSL
ncbi:reverse transcriptase domain-containing protein [Rheinheimera sp. UJ63]|uniref:reverse transcriptase domain-containing protein n=1 Tax=Rheinheimera sp. UJ63 TaxID=2910157 RepID=UPI001EFF189B|nr:reverse transcriptase domain-containing protein [Rheinheimera sp. UJ63]MCF4010411.1 hypothetical protein [Rheinheimera sp. UJ63]